MRFIDLFAGLGGFHHGMSNAGGFECVFASELDPKTKGTLRIHYGLKIRGDIRKVSEDSVPEHDVLCAGFPLSTVFLGGVKERN